MDPSNLSLLGGLSGSHGTEQTEAAKQVNKSVNSTATSTITAEREYRGMILPSVPFQLLSEQAYALNPVLFPEATEKTESLRKVLGINWDFRKLPDIVRSPEVIELHKAVVAGKVDLVKNLIAKGVDYTIPNEEGSTILHLSAKSGNMQLMSYVLLEVPKIDPNATDHNMRTALHYACHSKKRESKLSEEERAKLMACCSLLMGDPRINVDAKDRRHRTSLAIASRACLPSVVQMLLQRNANPNIYDESGRTPLHYACKNGDKDTLEALILAQANPTVRDKSGCHALHYAAKFNKAEIVNILKNLGAPLDPMDNAGRTPLMLTTDADIKWMLESRFTTATHPFVIDFVTHQVLGKSKIGMSMCPGRNRKNWRRKLEDDIAVMQKAGIQSVVSLVTDEELTEMEIPHLHPRLNSCDIETVHFPIVDKWVPNSMDDLVALVQMILVRVKRGKVILVHCNGGKGRTGLVVTATLVALGIDPDKAVEIIRKAREGMITNPAQLLYVRSFKTTWDKLQQGQ